MAKCMNNCGQCPFFEAFVREYEEGIGLIDKGRCHKHNTDEVWETQTACTYAEDKDIETLAKELFTK